MDRPKIFSDSIVNSSTEKVIADYRKPSYAIYTAVLLFVASAVASLFFINIRIGVSALGIIKPQGERNLITSPATGKLIAIHLSENLPVCKGDTLFTIDSRGITYYRPALEKRRSELLEMLGDLSKLTGDELPPVDDLKNSLYIRSYHSYMTQLEDYNIKEKVALSNYSRYTSLYESKVIPQSEFEAVVADKDNATLSRQAFQSSNKAQWQADLNKLENELRDVTAQIEQINIQSNEAMVLAPISGTIQSIEKVTNGMFVHSGQQIVEISPDGQLVVECAVSTKDIGFIHVGQKARIQVDAFNYNEWGVLEGEVMEIFDDVVISNDGTAHFYRIYCSLNSDHLTLKNGYRGYVKKGMTVSAHFIVTKRTIFQLIYDKADQWLNPNVKSNE
ncbi:MAG: HlyD family efflux transporter periplasmic adaptor subunit [Prevotellaceae bacterium]|jgi:HlyD family secretion protein|nr:HlyD family efflux transporter periplasmic adaptor subunit [Prevotellaceae bacterium]